MSMKSWPIKEDILVRYQRRQAGSVRNLQKLFWGFFLYDDPNMS